MADADGRIFYGSIIASPKQRASHRMQPLEIRRILTLRGPNIWANYPVLEAWVDLGELKDTPSTSIPGFNERLMSWLPSLIEHRCSIGERGGFFQRLQMGTYPAHVLEHVTLELQTLSGTPVGYGKARETSEEGVYKVIVRYRDENLARECLLTARELLLAAYFDRPFDVAGEVIKLKEVADQFCLGPSTTAIVEAARERGIPHRRLDAGRSLIQLGYGARQRRIWTAETDRTGAIAECIAQDKELTRSLLRQAGVPVPEGRQVHDAEDAWAAALEIGLPVVVKPRDGNHGRGVFIGLNTREQVMSAYEHALPEGSGVLVERCVSGIEHRLLVVGNQVVAAARGEWAYVQGDGRHKIVELIEQQLNTDPRRGDSDLCPLAPIDIVNIDSTIVLDLERQGFRTDSIPAAGVRVLIQRNGNLALDVTPEVHPEVADRVVLAAQVIGLDIAGVDLVAEDVSRPLEEQWGAIVEVNSSPGLLMHLRPSQGTPRPVGKAIVDSLFPPGETGRIPIVAVTGTNGKTSTSRLIAHILAATGHKIGLACTDGTFLAGRRLESGDGSGPQSARALLLNPRTEVAVLEVAAGGILQEGLGFDRCQIGVVLNLGEADHLGLSYMDTPEAMAKVKRCVVDVVLPDGVAILNAKDPAVAEMSSACKGKVTFFSSNSEHEVIVSHRQAGGRSVFVRQGNIVLAEGANERILCSLSDLPMILGGVAQCQIENTLAAAAACWALELPDELIRSRLASFRCDATMLPGRFNLFPIGKAAVVVDNCHNVQSIKALLQSTDHIPHIRRGIVFTCRQDRRDIDIVRQGEILAESFDRVWLYANGVGSRSSGQIISLLRQGLQRGGRVCETYEAADFDQAFATATKSLEAGYLLVVQADDIDVTLGAVRRLLTPHGAVDSGQERLASPSTKEVSVP